MDLEKLFCCFSLNSSSFIAVIYLLMVSSPFTVILMAILLEVKKECSLTEISPEELNFVKWFPRLPFASPVSLESSVNPSFLFIERQIKIRRRDEDLRILSLKIDESTFNESSSLVICDYHTLIIGIVYSCQPTCKPSNCFS